MKALTDILLREAIQIDFTYPVEFPPVEFASEKINDKFDAKFPVVIFQIDDIEPVTTYYYHEDPDMFITGYSIHVNNYFGPAVGDKLYVDCCSKGGNNWTEEISLGLHEQKFIFEILNEKCKEHLGKSIESLLDEARERMGKNE